MSKVLTVGTFDLPHSGHVELFRKCRKIADLQSPAQLYQRYANSVILPPGEVIVGLNSDGFVARFKGKLSVYDYEERYAVISAMKDVDKVIINSSSTLETLLEEVKPDFLVVGSDWAKKDYYKQIGVTEAWLTEHNITLLYVPYTEGISSTSIRGRLTGEPS